MNQWVPKNKTLAISGMIVLMGVVAYLSGLYAVNAKIGEIESAYQSSRSAVAEEEKVRAIALLVAEHQEAIEKLQNFFIAPGDEVSFIESIEDVGKQSGIAFDISSISEGRKEEGSLKEDLMLTIDVEGSWVGLLDFINGLESMPFGALITEIKIDAKGDSLWSGSVETMVFRAI